jgi:hypothetical protein
MGWAMQERGRLVFTLLVLLAGSRTVRLDQQRAQLE